MNFDTSVVLRIIVASMCGAAVGVERQWSGHATGPAARFGGVRTFTLLGALAGLAGWMWTLGATALAAVLLAGGVTLVIAGYVSASRRDVEATTEMAALVTLSAGALAGLGFLALASGVTAVAALLLVEKSRLHTAVGKLDDAEIRAGARFAVMAVVVLPLLPTGPYGPWGLIYPRELWLFVLLFSGMSFAGFIARRAVGIRHGYEVAGLLGGLISSTSVTFSFSRASQSRPEATRSLAFGILAASTVMYARVVAATAILNQSLMTALLPYLIAPFLAGLVLTIFGWRQREPGANQVEGPENPLELRSALQMALLFQVVLVGVHLAKVHLGARGVVGSGAILGLADMDALTISMAKTASDLSSVSAAAQAIAVGIISNNLFKLGIAAVLGRGAVRTLAPIGLAALVLLGGISIYLLL
jgi:uncharacterized membrane protein (DUF4010 family)